MVAMPPQRVPDSLRWHEMFPLPRTDGTRWPHRSKESKWPWMASDGSRWHRIAPDGSRLPKMVPDGSRCFQNAWKAICSPQNWISVLCPVGGFGFAECGVGQIARPRYLQMAPDDSLCPQMTTWSYFSGKVLYKRGRSL